MKIARSLWEVKASGELGEEKISSPVSFFTVQELFAIPWVGYELHLPTYVGLYIDREGHYGAGDRSLRLILGKLRTEKFLDLKYSISVLGYMSTACRQLDLPTFYDMDLDKGNRWLDG